MVYARLPGFPLAPECREEARHVARALAGAPITAVAKGRVDYVNWLEGYGKCAIINHGGGFYTLYANASEILVSVGKDVAAGETIGRVGDTGSTIGTALHFEIRKGREALNPLEWFR